MVIFGTFVLLVAMGRGVRLIFELRRYFKMHADASTHAPSSRWEEASRLVSFAIPFLQIVLFQLQKFSLASL
jgi:hypothetical protein